MKTYAQALPRQRSKAKAPAHLLPALGGILKKQGIEAEALGTFNVGRRIVDEDRVQPHQAEPQGDAGRT